MEAEQAKAAYQAAGEQKPWAKHAERQQEKQAEKAVEHGKGKDHGDPERVNQPTGPDRPGPAPAHEHAHAHHGHMPWDKNPGQEHGGHGHHLSKDNGQELAQGKPWERHADPDRAEARMAEQARAKERDADRNR
jgi:hypothetical protein